MSAASVPRDSSPVSNISSQATVAHGTLASPQSQKVEAFDEFDPRGPLSGTASHMNIFIFILASSLYSLTDMLLNAPHKPVTMKSLSKVLDRLEEMLTYI